MKIREPEPLDANDATRDPDRSARDPDGLTHGAGTQAFDDAERHLLMRAKTGLSPNAATLERLRARVEVALQSSTPNEQVSTSRETASRLTRATGIGLFILGAGVGTVGGFYWAKRSQVINTGVSDSHTPSHDSSQRTETLVSPSKGTVPSVPDLHPTTPPPAGGNPPARHETSLVTVPTEASKSRVTHRELTPLPTATHQSDEIFLVQRVQRALAQHDSKLALALLDKLDAELPRGRLLEERAAGRAIAVCMSDPSRGAAAHKRFTLVYPQSVHHARVTAICGAVQQKRQSTERE